MTLKRKFCFCLLILISYLCISYAFTTIMVDTFTVTEKSQHYLILLQQLFMSAVLLVFIVVFRYQKIFTYRKTSFLEGLYIGGFLFFYTIVIILLRGRISGFGSLYFTIRMFLIGFTEEILFRGIICDTLLDEDNLLNTSILASAIFGVAHFNNIFAGGNIESVIFQVLGAFAVGFYFTAIYYRTHNIWVVIILHTLNDYAALMGTENQMTIIDQINSYGIEKLIPFIVYIGLGIFLLRKENLYLGKKKEPEKALPSVPEETKEEPILVEEKESVSQKVPVFSKDKN